MKYIKLLLLLFLFGCQSFPAPNFNGTNAFNIIEQQHDMGNRHPGTDGIETLREYIITEVSKYGGEVSKQNFEFEAFGENHKGENIIVSFYPDLGRRILLSAHYDTRKFADKDPNPENHKLSVPGANDGGSGVAVLLEIARNLASERPIHHGVDMIFFDGEDGGDYGDSDSWCKGSQYFSSNLLLKSPEVAINIDMIGDKDQEIKMEHFSYNENPQLVLKLLNLAKKRDINTFTKKITDPIMDDHYHLIQAGFPAINIIDFDYKYWHTIEDTPDKCSAEALTNVGQVVMDWIYEE
jgi:Zn-dependent M28 family amino/carboxypeptidase